MNRPVIVTALALTTVPFLAPTVVQAAPYNVWACADSNSRALGPGDWTPARVNAALATIDSTCLNPPPNPTPGAPGGSMDAAVVPAAVNQATNASAGWTATAPAGVTIKGLDLWWHNTAPNTGSAAPGRIQIQAGSTILYTRDGGNFGSSGRLSDPANHQEFPSFNTSAITVQAVCLARCNDPSALASSNLSIYRVRLVVDDTKPPTGSTFGLTDGMATSAPITIQADATDVGSGVRDITLRVDGKTIQRIGGQDRCTSTTALDYATMHPCPSTLSGTFTLPPTLLDSATHHVTVIATDAAGQDTTLTDARATLAPSAGFYDAVHGFTNPDLNITGGRTVNGASGGPGTLTFGLPTGPRLHTARTIQWGKHPRVRGRLTTPDGQPVIGARVWLATATSPGAWTITGPPLTTSRTGTVSTILPAHQPSRTLQLVYFPYTDSNTSTTSPVVNLRVRAGVTLKATRPIVPAGGKARLTARLHADIPTGSSVLGTLQLQSDGRWRTFRQVRFRSGHPTVQAGVRFRHTPAGTSYIMRLRVPAQTGLGYATGTSKPIVLTVR